MVTIPTLAQLYSQVKSDLEATYTITIPVVGKSFLRALAVVQAAKLKLYYVAIAHLQKNIFVDTADPESMGGTMERYGRVKLGRSPFAAVAAQYTIQVTGTTGATIPATTTWKSDDGSLNPGYLFVLDTEFVLDGTNQIVVRALTPGEISALSISDTMSLTAPIALVNTVASVISETIAPQEAETIEAYRAKTLQAYRLEPQGGAAADYRLWAADVQSVQQTYPYVVSGNSNQINLFVEAVLADSTDGKGTPTLAILEDVEEAIEDPTVDRPGRKPLGVFKVNYLAVTIKEVAINISSFTGITNDQKTQLFNAIKQQLAEIRPFIGAIDVVANKNDIFSQNLIITKILDTLPGSVFGAVTLTVSGSPVTSYTFDNGEIPHLQEITYV